MSQRHKHDDALCSVDEKQRNVVFPDAVRNMGGFWRGLYEQKLNFAQSIGLLILVLFYVVLFVGLVADNWPAGPEPFWQKLLYGYGPYFLLSLPLLMFFAVLYWRTGRKK
jgi:hypothetical protein